MKISIRKFVRCLTLPKIRRKLLYSIVCQMYESISGVEVIFSWTCSKVPIFFQSVAHNYSIPSICILPRLDNPSICWDLKLKINSNVRIFIRNEFTFFWTVTLFSDYSFLSSFSTCFTFFSFSSFQFFFFLFELYFSFKLNRFKES